MEPSYNLTCLSLKEKPWLEPYDSTDRLNHYIFENNKRLIFKYMSFPHGTPAGYKNFAALANEADIVLFPITPNTTIIQYFNASFTVPFLYSYNTIISRKNVTVKEDSPGPFNNMLNVSYGVWMSITAILLLLTIIGIFEERINGNNKAMVRNFGDKIYNYYQALLGQSIRVPSLPAIRISNGIWLLELLVFINLFSGIMKANYTARPKNNINSIEDLLKTPDLYVQILSDDEIHLCNMKTEIFVLLCERSREDTKRTNYTASHIFNLLVAGKAVYIGDFAISIIFINFLNTIQNNTFKNMFHMSFQRYLNKPLIYHVSKNINPDALKLINRRLRSFFETHQFVVWQRRMEKNLGIDFNPPPYTPTKANCQPIRFQDIQRIFTFWILILSFAPFIAILEIFINWYLGLK